MDRERAVELVESARVARLATVTADHRVDLVPITYAVDDGRIVTAIDHKPKSTSQLKRLDNIRATGLACLLADSYDEDWSRLWWVRADASASVLAPGRQAAHAVGLLAAKYEQYASAPPAGPVIALGVIRWTGWAASPGDGGVA